MAYSEALALRVRQILSHRRGVTEKKMFGSIGFLVHGNMLVGIWKNSLIARLGSQAAEQALPQPYVGEFDITGRAMKGWVLIEPDGIDSDQQLNAWLEQAWDFCGSLPRK